MARTHSQPIFLSFLKFSHIRNNKLSFFYKACKFIFLYILNDFQIVGAIGRRTELGICRGCCVPQNYSAELGIYKKKDFKKKEKERKLAFDQ